MELVHLIFAISTVNFRQSASPILVPPSLRKSFLQTSTLTCFRSVNSSGESRGWPYTDEDSAGTDTLTS